MDTLPQIFITSFLVGLSGALMPGPVLVVTISHATRRGFIVGPLIVLGHAILELALVIGVILGLGRYLMLEPVTGILGIVGGGVLAWMGWGMLSGRDSAEDEGKELTQATPTSPVLAGILTSLSNPYWFLWWATVGMAYISLSLPRGVGGVGAFWSGHILSDLLWYSFMAGLIAAGRKFLAGRVYRWFFRACGVFLVLFGGYFLYRGIKIFV
jgi:threonine/homoserine/homoserine lactone efflux protein